MPKGEQVTIVGQIVVQAGIMPGKANKDYIEFVSDMGVSYELNAKDFTNTTKQFCKCLNDGKYKGEVIISGEIELIDRFGKTTKTPDKFGRKKLRFNQSSTCKRK